MDVMKMANISPILGIKPTSLVFWANVLSVHHIGSLMSPIYPHPPVYAALCLSGQCGLLHSSPWNCMSFKTYNYIYSHIMALHIHTPSRLNKHTAHSLYRIMVTATSDVDVMKLEILCLERESKPHICHCGPVCYHYII